MTMQQSYANILTAVGEDLNRPGLKDTPVRAAKAFSYLTSGYSQTLEEVTNKAVFPSDNREMVLVKNIEFYSLCEHHLLPFYGRVHIAYLPEVMSWACPNLPVLLKCLRVVCKSRKT